MCGIAAVLTPKVCDCSGGIDRALKLLRHRGPDGAGIWTSPRQTAVLGHTRLAVQGLESGGQPLCNEDGSIAAVVNGEFYEFAEQRTSLQKLGHCFRSESDSEILIHLYEQYGLDAVHRLQGEFAFVLWDDRHQLLLAARDRFGIKPLFWSRQQNALYFVSEIKALRALGMGLDWDEQGFLQQFIFQRSLNGRTLFKGVEELPPGSLLVSKAGHTTIHPYWDLSYPRQQEREQEASTSCDQEYAALVQNALRRAVRLRTRSEVPVSCYLSGGLDSTSVCALWARELTSAGEAFSLRFEDPTCDEFDAALETARLLGIHLHAVPIAMKDLLDNFSNTVLSCDSLLTNTNAVAKYCLSRAAHKAGYKVVLTGEGADELFAGYPWFSMDVIRQNPPLELHSKRQLPITSIDREWGYLPFSIELSCVRAYDLGHLFRDLLPNWDLTESVASSLPMVRRAGWSTLNKSLYLQAKTSLPGFTLSSLGDRVEMAHSVEGRLPFLDHGLVDLAQTLPDSQKIRHGVEKFALRNAMRSIIPASVCNRKKRPLVGPGSFGRTDISQIWDLVQDTLRSRTHDISFLNHTAVKELLDRMPSLPLHQQQFYDASLFALTSACMLSSSLLRSPKVMLESHVH